MRIFKTKTFARFARKARIGDKALSDEADALRQGQYAADLGGGVFKLRLARVGQGKSGGYRLIVAFSTRHMTVFVFGYWKNELDNISPQTLEAFKKLAKAYFEASPALLSRYVAEGELIEIEEETGHG